MMKFSLISAAVCLLAGIVLSVFADEPVVYMSYAKPSDEKSIAKEFEFMIKNHRRPTNSYEMKQVYNGNRSAVTYANTTTKGLACMAHVKNTFFVYSKVQPYGPDVSDYTPVSCKP